MALQIYEGLIQLYWKGADFRNLVHASIKEVDVGNKRHAWRKQVNYVRCRSLTCEHKALNKCPMMNGDICQCPNSAAFKIDQPRKDTKMYKEFTILLDRLPYLSFFGKYSAFAWDFQNHTVDQDDYEALKQIPEFAMNRISDAPHNLVDALAYVEEHKKYNLREFNYSRGIGCQLTNTLRMKYKDEVESYLKLVSMEAFLDKHTIELMNFKKNIGQLFHYCGEYVVMRIPCLADFEKYGLQNIFHYPGETASYSSNGFNAVKVEDFPYIYNYLVNYQPNPSLYKADKYQQFYVLVIKEQFAKFCSEHKINFAEDAV